MKKNFLFIVNLDVFFISHRLEIAKELKKRGYEVSIAAEYFKHEKFLKSLGFKTHNINFKRNSLNFYYAVKSILQILYLIKKINPIAIHSITIKPIIFSGIALYFDNRKKFFSVTGLGSMFIGNGFLNFLKKNFFKLLYKLILKQNNFKLIVQNYDDYFFFKNEIKINKKKLFLISGSGVNIKKFKYYKIPSGRPKVLMVSRIIGDKGVYDYIESIKIIKKVNKNIDFLLVGDPDLSNPSCIQSYKINNWKMQKLIKYYKFSNNVYNFFKKSFIVVLPSYREGFPKTIMEAASAGRPVITTNVPGCKDAVINNKTGLIVDVKKPKLLAKAIIKILKNKKKLVKMGRTAHFHAKKNFDVKIITKKHLDVYNLF